VIFAERRHLQYHTRNRHPPLFSFSRSPSSVSCTPVCDLCVSLVSDNPHRSNAPSCSPRRLSAQLTESIFPLLRDAEITECVWHLEHKVCPLTIGLLSPPPVVGILRCGTVAPHFDPVPTSFTAIDRFSQENTPYHLGRHVRFFIYLKNRRECSIKKEDAPPNVFINWG